MAALLVVQLGKDVLREVFAFDESPQTGQEIEFIVGNLLFRNSQRGRCCFVCHAADGKQFDAF